MKRRIFAILCAMLFAALMLPVQAAGNNFGIGSGAGGPAIGEGAGYSAPGVTAKIINADPGSSAYSAACGANELKVRFEDENGKLLQTTGNSVSLGSSFSPSALAGKVSGDYSFTGASLGGTAVDSFENTANGLTYTAGGQSYVYNQRDVLILRFQRSSSPAPVEPTGPVGVTILYTVNDASMGYVTRTSETLDPASESPKGSTAVANEGFEFVEWRMGEYSYSTDATIVPLPKDNSYMAVFKAKSPQPDPAADVVINYVSGNTDRGIVTSASETLPGGQGTVVGSTAMAKEGFAFVEWQLNGQTYSTSATIQPEAKSATYVALFQQEEEQPPAADVVIRYSVNDAAMGSVSLGEETLPGGKGTVQGSTAAAKPGFAFVEWRLNGLPYSTDATIIPLPVSNSYVAVFRAVSQPSLVYISYQSASPSMGYVTRGSETLRPGDSVLGSTAVAYSGYEFVKWTKDGADYAYTATILPPALSGAYVAVFRLKSGSPAGSYTVSVPVTKTVDSYYSGVNPGSASFRFVATGISYKPNYTVLNDTIYTTGTGSFSGFYTLRVDSLDALDALCQGFYLSEYNGGSLDWSYSTAQWYVQPSYTVDGYNRVRVSVSVYPVSGGVVQQTPSSGARFSNVYLGRNSSQTGQDITVTKRWVGSMENVAYVQLYADGRAYGPAVALSQANNWSYTWYNMQGNYRWTVDEVNVPSGYSRSVSQRGNTFTITNSRTGVIIAPQTGSFSILGFALAGAGLGLGLVGKGRKRR